MGRAFRLGGAEIRRVGSRGARPRRPAWTWLPAALWLLASLHSAPPSWPQSSPAGAVAKPAASTADLADLCEQWTRGDNHFFGRAGLERLRQRLDSADLEIPQRVETMAELGQRLLRLGDTEESVARLEEALDEARRHGAPPRILQILRFDLALAHLSLAEDQNCVLNHGAASCILPVAPEAVHRLPTHTRRSAALFEEFLTVEPGDFLARWLYNVARQVAGDTSAEVPERHRLPPLTSDVPFPRWTNIAPALGVDSFDLAGGAVMDDFDGDGLLDLVSTTWDPCGSMKAFRNDGEGGFEDVTVAWGLETQFGGLNLVHADYDNDGRLDLLVLRGAWLGEHGRVRNSLLRNTLVPGAGGQGEDASMRFVDVTIRAGLEGRYPTQTAAWADYDLDGDLDLYIGNEAAGSVTLGGKLIGDGLIGDGANSGAAGGDRAYPSELYRNEGDGTFTELAAEAGVENLRLAKGVAWGDYDDDGDPDLFVSNLAGGPNRLYRNDGARRGPDGRQLVTFTDVAASAGVGEPVGRSFPTWFFDFDNDGDLDLLVAAYGASPAAVAASYFGVAVPSGQPLLYRNEGDGTFTERGRELGLKRPLLPMGSNYGDLDNDGSLDLYFGTGSPPLESVMPNVMYLNANGRRFHDVTAAGGFGHIQKGHGVAFGDIDNDGDQDIFQQMGGAFPVDAYFNTLYENPGVDAAAGWITLRLEGRRANRFGLGARLEVRIVRASGERRSLHLLVGSGGSFGGSSLQQEIGLGDAAAIEEIEVRWPGGGTQRFGDVALGRIYRLVEGEEELLAVELPVLELGRHGASHSGYHP